MEKKEGEEVKNAEAVEDLRLKRTLLRITKKALLNEYRLKMEEALIKQ